MAPKSSVYRSLHTGDWWERQSRAAHLSWNAADQNDSALYNGLLWNGILGTVPYPSNASGVN